MAEYVTNRTVNTATDEMWRHILSYDLWQNDS